MPLHVRMEGGVLAGGARAARGSWQETREAALLGGWRVKAHAGGGLCFCCTPCAAPPHSPVWHSFLRPRCRGGRRPGAATDRPARTCATRAACTRAFLTSPPAPPPPSVPAQTVPAPLELPSLGTALPVVVLAQRPGEFDGVAPGTWLKLRNLSFRVAHGQLQARRGPATGAVQLRPFLAGRPGDFSSEMRRVVLPCPVLPQGVFHMHSEVTVWVESEPILAEYQLRKAANTVAGAHRPLAPPSQGPQAGRPAGLRSPLTAAHGHRRRPALPTRELAASSRPADAPAAPRRLCAGRRGPVADDDDLRQRPAWHAAHVVRARCDRAATAPPREGPGLPLPGAPGVLAADGVPQRRPAAHLPRRRLPGARAAGRRCLAAGRISGVGGRHGAAGRTAAGPRCCGFLPSSDAGGCGRPGGGAAGRARASGSAVPAGWAAPGGAGGNVSPAACAAPADASPPGLGCQG